MYVHREGHTVHMEGRTYTWKDVHMEERIYGRTYTEKDVYREELIQGGTYTWTFLSL